MRDDLRSASDARFPWTFVLLTYSWSWLWWIPIIRLPKQSELGDLGVWGLLCLLVGAYGPSLMGLLCTARDQGPSEVRRQLRSLGSVHGAWWALALSLLVPWAMMALGLAFARFAGAELGPATWSRWSLLPIAVLAAIPFGPLAEEFGWRGHALPRLVQRWGGLGASVVVGLLWTAWHVPLFWAPAGSTISGGPVNGWTVGAYALTLVAISCLATWLLARAGHLMALAVAVHVGFNVDMPMMPFRSMGDAVSSEVAVWTGAAALLVIALLGPVLRGVRRL